MLFLPLRRGTIGVGRPVLPAMLLIMEESSSSILLELIEGVLDPVLVEGDCSGDSLNGLCSSGGENAKDFSVPVIASDIALRPVARDLGAVLLYVVGDGTGLSIEDVSLSGLRGDPATVSMLGAPNSRLVTIGEPGDHDFPI